MTVTPIHPTQPTTHQLPAGHTLTHETGPNYHRFTITNPDGQATCPYAPTELIIDPDNEGIRACTVLPGIDSNHPFQGLQLGVIPTDGHTEWNYDEGVPSVALDFMPTGVMVSWYQPANPGEWQPAPFLQIEVTRQPGIAAA